MDSGLVPHQAGDVGRVRPGGGEKFEPCRETDVVPNHLAALSSTPNLDRQSLRPQNVHTVLVTGHNVDLGGLIELGDVMDSPLLGPIASHVVDVASACYNQPVSPLFDPLDMLQRRVIRLALVVN